MSERDCSIGAESQVRTVVEPSKRHACDRCHGQKLRCEWTSLKNSAAPCRRCARAGARCITSPPRRSGRPSQKSKPTTPMYERPDAFDFDMTFDGIEAGDDFEDDGIIPQQAQFLDNFHPILDPQLENNTSNSRAGTRPAMPQVSLQDSVAGNMVHNEVSMDQLDAPNHARTEPASTSGFSDALEEQTSSEIKRPSLQRLLALTSQVLELVEDVTANGLPNTLLPQSTPTTSTTPVQQQRAAAADAGESPNSNSCIGRMLDRSQEFLDILQSFVTLDPSVNVEYHGANYSDSSSSPYSEDSTSSGSLVNHSHRPSRRHSAERMHLANSSHGGYSRRRRTLPANRTYHPYNQAPAPARLLPGQTTPLAGTTAPTPSSLDLPIRLSILACFTSLRRVYRLVFSSIYSQLLRQHPQPSLHGISSGTRPAALLPGLQVAGFQLDAHHGLQIGVLRQISADMLQRMEDLVGALDDVGSANHSGRGSASDNLEEWSEAGRGSSRWKGAGPHKLGGAPSLLDTVLRQEAFSNMLDHTPDHLGTAEMSLRGLMQNIKQALKNGYGK